MKHFFLALLLPFCVVKAQELSAYKEFTKDSARIGIINLTYGPVEVSVFPHVYFQDSIHIHPKFLINARDSMWLASIPLKHIKDTSKIQLKRFFNIKAMLGDSKTAKHDSTYSYSLPYSKDKPYKVVQGFNGKFTHNSIKSKYAIDFNLAVGDTIYAAREGIIVRIRDKFKVHGGRDFIDKANLITILHEDGTLAAYVHLDYQGVLVKPGDFVHRGQPIGISGLTGFTRGPHLHFVVREGNDKSVPVFFEGYEKKYLKSGKKYVRKK
ncbi:M23 family metallopeptidase [Ascidiimonas sp. W6]|uniref:M23 family metallopeptidase n=1 Tax=Ascidiimonas meishanensis TaxID=3128903 RepID=UPI0030EDD6DC